MTDEALYRQYLSGDDAGLEALMKKYGDPLTCISTAICTTFTRRRS